MINIYLLQDGKEDWLKKGGGGGKRGRERGGGESMYLSALLQGCMWDPRAGRVGKVRG